MPSWCVTPQHVNIKQLDHVNIIASFGGGGATGLYGSVYGPSECCDNVYMVELFYVDMSMYNTSWRHEIRKRDHLNYCDQPWRSIRRQEISKHDHINYYDKTWISFRRLAITHLVDKIYCGKMLSEFFVIIIYVNKYAMMTCHGKTRWHVQITTKLVDINLCEKEWRSVQHSWAP